MEWSKLKNVILLMLVCVNVILLLLVGSQESRDHRYREETLQAVQEVLEKGGITFGLDEVPEDLSLPLVTVNRDRDSEAAVAAALLGEVTLQGESEVRPRYAGEGGTAEFSMNGSFTISLQPGVRTLESGEDYDEASQACLEAMGFTGTLEDLEMNGSDALLTYCQSWDGSPLFSCSVSLYWQGEDLIRVEGQRLDGTVTASSNTELLSTTTILVQFLAGINEGGYVCSRIDDMTAGYLTSSNTTRQIQLTPVWRFLTDTGTYYVNAVTGEFTPLE